MNLGRLGVALLGVGLVLAGCSSDDDGALPPVEAVETTATTEEPTTTAEVTTTTEAPSTTLSEEELAEAEIREVVTGWWQLEYDMSGDSPEVRLEPLTGLQLQKVTEFDARLEAEGIFRRAVEPGVIEITGVALDIEGGTAEVEACTAATAEFVDSESLEVVGADDPSQTTTSLFQLQLIDDQWKISGWFPSELEASGAVSCEVES